MNMYSVFDSKVAAYTTPFLAKNDASATRMFVSAATQEDHDFHRFGGDYTLFRIAKWDEETAQIQPEITFTNLGTARAALATFVTNEDL